MVYTSAITSPARYQFESNSAPNQAYNCGPTVATAIAQFYRDQWYGIEATRNLATAADYRGTSATEQGVMLAKRGVPNTVRYLNSVAELHAVTDSGRRPVLLGILMGRVPYQYRDHSFTGWHAVMIRGGGYLNGVRGFWIMDPNFNPPGSTYSLDPDRGKKWYPDWVMQTAWANVTPRWAVVPNAAKVIATTAGRGHVATPSGTNVCNIRSGASYSAAIYARARSDGYTYRVSDGVKLWRNSSQFLWWGWTNTDWANCTTTGGLRLYVHRSVFVIDHAL